MNILFANPIHPDTFWSFKHALRFVSKKSGSPPLGLLTVAAMLPSEWKKELIDLNIEPLRDEHIRWADYVFLGGMSIQKASARLIIDRCHRLGRKVVAGGPLFTAFADEFGDVEHLVLNEAELTLPRFLDDLRNGRPLHRYESSDWADVTSTPVPSWNLLKAKRYSSMNIQYSRGCPYDCEFCDITVLYGRIPRTKTREQIIAELQSLYDVHWRGGVFFVDDNFIGNKMKLKREILPAIIDWMELRRRPFDFYTEVSINLADDDELIDLMVRAGFRTVFVGIESPNEESLAECRKIPNRNRDLVSSVRSIQSRGLQVQGGFIVGFDHDPAAIFQRLIDFIQETGIVTAMVGMLNAPKGSRLYTRLQEEGRLLRSMSGDNTDFSTNMIPRMGYEALLKGYRSILDSIYSPKQYYSRVIRFLRSYHPPKAHAFRIRWNDIAALGKSVVILGIVGKERVQYWKLFFWSLFTRPRLFPLAITFSIYGFHFRRVFETHLVESVL